MTDIRVSDAAFSQIAKVLASEGRGKALRVSVLGGGCSGFQYRFELDAQVSDDDLVVERDGTRVLIDAVSQPFLDGAVIDYKNDLIGAHFAVDNPNAAASCGCGTSFSI